MSYVKIGNMEINSASGRIMLRSVTDSASGNVSRRESKYPGYDGSEVSDITFNPRTVTVNGTLYGNSVEDVKKLQNDLMLACNPTQEAEVYYHNGHREYYAKALPSELPVFNKLNNHTYQFAIYLDLRAFWWLSPSEINEGVFVRENNIKGSLSLPQPFTVRKQGADIYNNGAIAVPLVIDISIHEAFKETLVIRNATYDLSVVIENYSFTKDEIISINMGTSDDFTVTSSVNGNIIKYLSEESEFFSLEKGYNRLECDHSGISVVARYRERFLGV